MENLINAYYDRFFAELDLNLPHSVYFEMITARLSMMIAECDANIITADSADDPRFVIHAKARRDALILLSAEVTIRALTLFVAEGFTAEQELDHYPKETGDWGEDLEEGA